MKIFLLALGALLAVLSNFNLMWSCLLATLLLILFYLNKNTFSAKEAIVFLLVFLAFFVRTWQFDTHNVSQLNNGNMTGVLEIVDNVQINGNRLKTTGYLKDEKVIVYYKLNSEQEKKYFEQEFSGGKLLIKGELSDIKEKKNYYAFDYKLYNERQGIFKVVTIEKIEQVNAGNFSNGYRKFLNNRANFIKNIHEKISFDRVGYFEALIFGDKSFMQVEDRNTYRDLGISHLLAISGLHIAALLGIVYKILRFIGLSINTTNNVILLLLPVYTVIVGLQPSVLRAAIMVMLYIILRRKNIKSISALLSAFLFLLFTNPYYIFNVGFQFSFFISFSLIMSADYINNSSNYFFKAFKISFIATIASFPISIAHFYSFSYLSLISNIVFVPFFTIILFPLILISFVIFLVNEPIFNILCVSLLNFIFSISGKLENIFLNFQISWFVGNKGEIFIFIVLILSIYILVTLNKEKLKLSSAILVTLLLIVFCFNNFYPRKVAEELNIGNNNIQFFRNNNTTILVNTSNNLQDFYKDYRKRKENYDIMNEYNLLFAYEGIKKIDYLVLSETSSKKIGYAETLIGKKMIRRLLITENIANNELVEALIELAQFQNIQTDCLKANKIYNIEGINLKNREQLEINYLEKNFIVGDNKQ